MTKLFLSANSVLALVFTSALVFSASVSFAAQGLELRIDSDNNGVIDNSSWERRLTKNPYAFGKFIPYSETDEEFVEIQVVVPQANSRINAKRTLKFSFESNEVSLWAETSGRGKTCLFKPEVNTEAQPKNPPESSNPKKSSGTFNSLFNNWKKESTTQDDNTWWGLGQRVVDAISNRMDDRIFKFFLNRNIDEVFQEEPVTEIVENITPQKYIYTRPIPSERTILTFYLKSEVEPRPADWKNSRTFKRPTRTLTVTLYQDSVQTAFDSAKYMVVGQNSIYEAIQKCPLLSEAFAARAVYYPDTDVKKFGLELLEFDRLGISDQDYHNDSSGFRIQLYRDWVHDKYYVSFKGTDIKLSDISNDVLLCMGNPSPFLWKALKFGCLFQDAIPENDKEKCILVGHSLGGALATGAGIVSGIRTDTFNSLGLSYQTLISTIDVCGADDPVCNRCKARVEKCFLKPKSPEEPYNREFDPQAAPIFTFHTKFDILTILSNCINIKFQTPNGIQPDILPSALGQNLAISNQEDSVFFNLDKEISMLQETVKIFDRVFEVCLKDDQEITMDNIMKHFKELGKDPSFLISIGKLVKEYSSSSPISKMKELVDYSTQRHLMDAVIEEILIQSGMSEAYGIMQKQ